ncbi:ABC transporter ATP-binding protein [Streptomyces sp. NPDC051940]|uniref:ABC transporter ATP-binding protein n=1 Tax=Streptomyces sp. NPDC051940 TaxID=3155675 RepID=UPI00341C5C52
MTPGGAPYDRTGAGPTTGTWGAYGLTVAYHGRPAVDDVTLAVPRGQVTAVVGGDGAGKTTLLRTLVGGIAPAAGTVSAPPREHRGFMPTGNGVWRELSVDENIDFVAAAYGLRGTELKERRAELLAAAGLTQAHGRLAGQLSGGMRQKLAFCLAILHRPGLLVLDEPSTGVDPVSRVDLWRLISQAAAGGAAVAMATTYLDEAERASYVLVLDEGRALAAGTPAHVMASTPGTLTTHRPPPADPGRSWRRGRLVHAWQPEGTRSHGEPVTPDLEDSVIARTLADRERRTAPGSRP